MVKLTQLKSRNYQVLTTVYMKLFRCKTQGLFQSAICIQSKCVDAADEPGTWLVRYGEIPIHIDFSDMIKPYCIVSLRNLLNAKVDLIRKLGN